MKPFPVLSTLALLVAACAPPPPASSPAPATNVEAADARTPVEALTTAPDEWWLLDAGQGVRGTAAERAYRELLADRQPRQSVVVAVLDSGIDIEHEDLDDVLWVNEDELPGNGVDDDRNGYVDDVHGWNFIGGPDGRHVHFDTFEVTRLYAALRGRYENARRDTLSGAALAEYDRFLEIRREWQEARAEAEEQLQQMRMINTAVERTVELLSQELGTDELTVERVRALRPSRPDVAQARNIYLQLAEQGITPSQVRDQFESIEGRYRYGLNPDFDPRDIVGDDYQDATERVYGNPDVEGPSAEHGTHVAGIIAAERGNGVGVNGIAPAVRIMVLRVVPDGDERDKDVANAIRYAADNGADVINMSFGKGHSPRKDVVDAAVRYADERGVLMVHAAGNDAADIGLEPSFPVRDYLDGGEPRLWLEVGASSWRPGDQLVADFSNYGAPEVDVFAPGHDILSTVPDDRYEVNSGTSMAAPVVSGLAALIMAYYPDLSPAEVKDVILQSASRFAEERVRRPGSETETIPFGELSATGGVVNAYEALRLAEQRSSR